MAINFLYIDDESTDKVEGLSKHLRLSPERLTITIEQPKTWNTQIEYLLKNQYLNQFDGLLLDLKLELPNEEDQDIKYYGSDLAQALRTLIKSGKITDLPILLCTTDNFLSSYFDKTSVDLFDKKYSKEKDLESPDTVSEFISFANAYKFLSNNDSLENVLAASPLSTDDLVAVELMFKEFKTVHEKSSFIFNQIIKSPGLLIDEDLLAIRLGVDAKKSKDWTDLKIEIEKQTKFKGVLSDAFQRWWQRDLEKWWKDMFGKSLKVLSALEKVEFLKRKIGLDGLVQIETPMYHKYASFWYKCRLSDFPLETADGLRTIEMPRYVWQEPSYISMAYIMSDERNSRSIKSLLGAQEQKQFDAIIDKQRK